MTCPESDELLHVASSAPRILIVEDEFVIASDIERCLADAGYEVAAISSSGQRAVELAERLQPDLVLMDIQLPGELDGISAATRIGERFGLPVVFLTAQSDPATLARAQVAGPFGYVVKPFSEKALYGAVETAIAKHAQERQVRESEQWLGVVLRNLNEGILVLDEDRRITMLNPIAEGLLGVAQARVIGRPIENVLTVEEEESCNRLDLRCFDSADAEPWGTALVLRSFTGRSTPIDLRLSTLPSGMGRHGGWLVQLQDVTERRAADRKIRHLALHDALTGLANRTLAFDRLEMLLAQARRRGTKVGVVFIDLDHFKSINDALGHDLGDHFLREVAERLQRGRRDADTVARLGGDEFLLLLGDLSERDALQVALDDMVANLADPIQMAGSSRTASASIGVSLFPDDGCEAEVLIRKADQAMYAAKHAGRACYRFAEQGDVET